MCYCFKQETFNYCIKLFAKCAPCYMFQDPRVVVNLILMTAQYTKRHGRYQGLWLPSMHGILPWKGAVCSFLTLCRSWRYEIEDFLLNYVQNKIEKPYPYGTNNRRRYLNRHQYLNRRQRRYSFQRWPWNMLLGECWQYIYMNSDISEM
jgi:hypothetical protein